MIGKRGLFVILLTSIVLSGLTTAYAQTNTLKAASQAHQLTSESEQSHGEAGGLGTKLPIWSVIPFIGILLSIAIFPLTAPHFWHRNFGKISAFWGLIFAIPFITTYQGSGVHELLHIYFKEYIPFIILLWALFTVAGGIWIRGAPIGTPLANVLLLTLGTFFASWIGTTGAAMILIRPLIRMNKVRKNKVHLIIFFIFLVANIGGSLTPLGDPPLFLGFLNGVPFFWTFNIFPHMIIVASILLTLFFLIDWYMFHKEGLHRRFQLKGHHIRIPSDLSEIMLEEEVVVEDTTARRRRRTRARTEIRGLVNFIFLVGIVGGVLFSGFVHLGEFSILGIKIGIQDLIRDAFLVLMGLLSLKFTPRRIRMGNEFSWFPIIEVGKLFAGIFTTMAPAIAMLRAGQHSQLGFIIESVKDPHHYFWITGALSSFLDNAPTYLVFLSTSLGQFFAGMDPYLAVHSLIAHQEIFLKAISAGAVFFGAMTYIGNAPNFMVKSIAEEAKIKMPSFFGYMIYSLLILIPLFVLVTLIFF